MPGAILTHRDSEAKHQQQTALRRRAGSPERSGFSFITVIVRQTSCCAQCPLWVKSRHQRPLLTMSALPPKADIIPHCIKCPLIAKSGHSLFLNNHRNVAHRDAGGGAVHSINSGH